MQMGIPEMKPDRMRMVRASPCITVYHRAFVFCSIGVRVRVKTNADGAIITVQPFSARLTESLIT